MMLICMPYVIINFNLIDHHSESLLISLLSSGTRSLASRILLAMWALNIKKAMMVSIYTYALNSILKKGYIST